VVQLVGVTALRILCPQEHTVKDQSIVEAAAILRNGGLVAFPTETVYGLGARFDCPDAVERLFAAKGRPADNPLIAHISHPRQLTELVTHMTPLEERLMLAFWPGPLTLVLPKTEAVPPLVTAGLTTVGVRMPAHDIALALITATGVPIVAPSANLSGRPSPTAAKHVAQDVGDRIDALVDGGETQLGLESTVVQVRGSVIYILRPGTITRQMLAEETGAQVQSSVWRNAADHAEQKGAPLSPGMKYKHYAPRAGVIVYEGKAVHEIAQDAESNPSNIAVIAFRDTLSAVPAHVPHFTLGERGQADMAAKKLYAYLREIDDLGLAQVLVEGITPTGLGEAVMNRLYKAATQVKGR